MTYELTYDDIYIHVTQSSLLRGTTYYRRGAVSNVKVEDERTIIGQVRGSAVRPYKTRIIVGEEGIVASICSCPLSGECKHVVALGLEALHELAGSVDNTLVLKPDNRPLWEQSLESLVSEEIISTPSKNRELMIAMRVSPSTRDYTSINGWEIELRPRVFDPDTNRVSFNIDWPGLHTLGRSHLSNRLSKEQAYYLEQLAYAIDPQNYMTKWEHVVKDNAEAVWRVLHQAPEYGVKLVTEKTDDVIDIHTESITRELVLEDESSGEIKMRQGLFQDGEELKSSGVLLAGEPPVFGVTITSNERGATPVAVAGVTSKNERMPNISEAVTIPKEDLKSFQNRYAHLLTENYGLKTKTKRVTVPRIGSPKGLVRIDRLKGEVPGITVTFHMMYGNKKLPLIHDKDNIKLKRSMEVVPDKKKEADIIESIRDGLIASVQDQDISKKLKIQGPEAPFFLFAAEEEWGKNPDIEIEITEDVPEFDYDYSVPTVEFNVNQTGGDSDWFDLNITVKISGEPVPFAALFEALVEDQKQFMLPSGRYFDLAHEDIQKLRTLIVESGKTKEVTKDGLKISRFQVDYWNELTKLGIVDKEANEWQKQMKSLSRVKVVKYKPPQSLKADLRDYQLKGYSWLRFLYTNKMGGVLADDMGLGKTVQMIALLASRPQGAGPALIVAPTSVVDSWASEMAKFAPHLKVTAMHPGDRDYLYEGDGVEKADAVIISYSLLWRDLERLKKYEFDMCVLDEAQFVKNYQSKIYMSVRQLRRLRTFALTGTPMENGVMELWSITSIVAPGLFAEPKHFREHFQRPIEKQSDKQALSKLRSRIRPFFMRRNKEQVETELPPKTIQTVILDLHDKHRHVYDVHLQRERKRILGLLAEGGMQAHRFEILKSITKMRQMALHPGLVNKKEGAITNAKLDEVVRQVQELASEGRKCLIFSQFTSFLSYVKERLEKSDIQYLYLDGSTRNRGKLVEKFQSPECTECAFVISLKAGGVGLTLTAADYCFILDPWWNPAIENQAIDRTHRIGQDKPVHVYKMIGKSTIEEKVLALQEKKAKLFKDVIEGDGTFAKGITDNDIRLLIE